MDIKTLYPLNSLLKDYIDHYYFLKIDDSKSAINYLAYPHVNTPVSICKGISLTKKINEIIVTEVDGGQHTPIAFGYFENPLSLKFNGSIDEITIVFKPLGLNHFIKADFNEIVDKTGGYFSAWDSEHFNKMTRALFLEDDLQERLHILEKFLCSQFTPFRESVRLSEAIALLTDFDKNHTIGYIADHLSIHSRTLHRLFINHFGISPKAYKKIAQFRHSLEYYPDAKKTMRLIDIAYSSNYYDHSYFIKMFKNLAHTNPAKFFNSVELNANKKFIMKVVKE